jgi:hypothetical protein
MHYAFFLECQLFYFSVLFSFVCCNKWLDPNKFLLEKLPCFSFAKNRPFFTLIVQRVFSFSRTMFSFQFFALICVEILSYLCINVYFDLWSMLVFIKRVVFKKGSNGVGKEKKFHAKKWYTRSLCRLRPRLLHVMLDVFLIIFLVIFSVA